jgi:hypothetical protein
MKPNHRRCGGIFIRLPIRGGRKADASAYGGPFEQAHFFHFPAKSTRGATRRGLSSTTSRSNGAPATTSHAADLVASLTCRHIGFQRWALRYPNHLRSPVGAVHIETSLNDPLRWNDPRSTVSPT